MGWYFVTKKIKGHSYLYRQRTWREGGKVRCRSEYLCSGSNGRPKGRAIQIQNLDPEKAQAVPIGEQRLVYHGSREGMEGNLKASEGGRYGSGFYLTDKETADLYARYSPKTVLWMHEYSSDFEQEHDGEVYTFDIGRINVITVAGDAGYTKLLDAGLDHAPNNPPPLTQKIKERFRELLEAQGYDGIEILADDEVPYQIVVFESALKRVYEQIDNKALTLKIPRGKE